MASADKDPMNSKKSKKDPSFDAGKAQVNVFRPPTKICSIARPIQVHKATIIENTRVDPVTLSKVFIALALIRKPLSRTGSK